MINNQCSIINVQGKGNATSCTLYATSTEKGHQQRVKGGKIKNEDDYITKEALLEIGIFTPLLHRAYFFFESLIKASPIHKSYYIGAKALDIRWWYAGDTVVPWDVDGVGILQRRDSYEVAGRVGRDAAGVKRVIR